MNNPRVNIRYAQALFDLAIERNEIEEARRDMKLIATVCSQNEDLISMLKSPVINSDKKTGVIRQLFGNQIGKLSLSFVEIIIRKRREAHLYPIVSTFEDLYLDYRKIIKATVTSAEPLSAGTRESLLQLLESQSASKIVLSEVVDPSILGGLIVKVKNQLFDDSIKQKLQLLRKEFNVNTYIREF
jgi:F-type H+-transporting ATPase subunit delta